MRIKEIRSLGEDDLKVKLEDLKKELIKINAQVAIGTTPKNPGQVKQIKKTIAKILTVLNKKESNKEEGKKDE